MAAKGKGADSPLDLPKSGDGVAHGGAVADTSPDGQSRRRRSQRRPFPVLIFEQALVLGMAIQKFAAGNKVR
jgi:hypothetical protein